MLTILNPNSHVHTAPLPSRRFTPRTDIIETAERYLISLDLPGFPPEHVEVSLERETLVVQGRKNESGSWAGTIVHQSERPMNDFVRKFRLPRGVDPDQAKAQFSLGVLKISLPKSAEALPRQIQIQSPSSQPAQDTP